MQITIGSLRLYLDKTGNKWENRKNFEKHPSKFFPIDIDYGEVIA